MEKEKGTTGKKTDATLQKEMTDAQVKALWQSFIDDIKGRDLPQAVKTDMLEGIRNAMRSEGDKLGKDDSSDGKIWDDIIIKSQKSK